MSHRVHPKMYRIPIAENWSSRWFNLKNLKTALEEDFRIRQFIKNKLKSALLEIIEIERFQGKTVVMISAARPGLLIGRGGAGTEVLRHDLERIHQKLFGGKDKANFKIEVREVKKPDSSAAIIARVAAEQIEKRIHFRRVMKQALDKIMQDKEVRGAKIELSGRLGGGEFGRREWLAKGSLPRTTIRHPIDYALDEAFCTYGTIGVKVWIYKQPQSTS